MIQIKNQISNIQTSKFTCSIKCKQQREEEVGDDYEEYWNSRCGFFYIYKITNKLTEQAYIGFTQREPLFRWWEHLKHSKLPIGVALNEIGIENFTFEILEKHDKNTSCVEKMHALETEYMLKFDSINNGYNCMVSKIGE